MTYAEILRRLVAQLCSEAKLAIRVWPEEPRRLRLAVDIAERTVKLWDKRGPHERAERALRNAIRAAVADLSEADTLKIVESIQGELADAKVLDRP